MDQSIRIHRLDLGYFVRPSSETGGSHPRVEPVLAYAVRHPDGVLLFDTGIGDAGPETEAYYRPHRRPLDAALAGAGLTRADITLIVNCHLHFDHCGGNPLFPGIPILVQAAELATARRGGYTADHCVDFPGATYQELDGEAKLLPGIRVLPTPGHTPGHQSLAVTTSDGTTVLAGQAHDTSAEYGAAHLARHATLGGLEPPLPPCPTWHDRLAELDPRRAFFAHDSAVWESVTS
ncbi:N-acyl homoserine lactonase family protein [Kitasatospora terrestris]|uniref:Metallo-beta-lactamase domain-containing protein n=1 Tax=Kitasatospora terrestris TaxID=258051 RepID=A0ABP9EF34_9ACTN